MEKFLADAAGIDEFLQYVMCELETCEEKRYGENLSASHYIDNAAREKAFRDVRDKYCEFKNKIRKVTK